MNGASREGKGETFYGVDPATGEQLEPAYHYATVEDLNLAAELADEAFAVFSKTPGKERARIPAHGLPTGLKPSCLSLWSAPIAKRRCPRRD